MKNQSQSIKKILAISIALGAAVYTSPSYALFGGGTSGGATEITQIASWAAQYAQMVKELKQLEEEYRSLNGVRGMAGLANNPALRKYLPTDYQTILDSGYGNWLAIRNSAKIYDIRDTNLNPNSDAVKLFDNVAKQAALNRATYEAAYRAASLRISDIEALLAKVNDAPDAKDMADLQGRIQAEQVLMANEQNKLKMLTALSQAQKDLYAQQSIEINLKSGKGPMPKGW